jgi:hypothetical protein
MSLSVNQQVASYIVFLFLWILRVGMSYKYDVPGATHLCRFIVYSAPSTIPLRTQYCLYAYIGMFLTLLPTTTPVLY